MRKELPERYHFIFFISSKPKTPEYVEQKFGCQSILNEKTEYLGDEIVCLCFALDTNGYGNGYSCL